MSGAYERTCLNVTTNLPSENWTEVLGNVRLSGALVDRLTHRVHIVEANGESYRARDGKLENADRSLWIVTRPGTSLRLAPSAWITTPSLPIHSTSPRPQKTYPKSNLKVNPKLWLTSLPSAALFGSYPLHFFAAIHKISWETAKQRGLT